MPFVVIVLADYIAQVLFDSIRIAAFTIAVGNINVVNSKSGGKAFNSLFSVLIATILFLLFFGFCLSF